VSDFEARCVKLLCDCPVTNEVAGRTSLLTWLPDATRNSLERSHTNRHTDLTLIVKQLTELGPLDDGSLPLCALLDAARKTVIGMELATRLQQLIDQVANPPSPGPPPGPPTAELAQLAAPIAPDIDNTGWVLALATGAVLLALLRWWPDLSALLAAGAACATWGVLQALRARRFVPSGAPLQTFVAVIVGLLAVVIARQ